MKNQKGFSLIELLIVVVIIGIIAAIAIPNLLAARRSANEASAIASLRTITGAQATYQSSIGNGTVYADGAGLQAAGLIDASVNAANGKSGYLFTVAALAPSGTVPAYFDARAVPVQFGAGVSGTGSRSFYTNESGTIFVSTVAAPPAATSATDRTVTGGSPLNN